jgi:hypothetical protein
MPPQPTPDPTIVFIGAKDFRALMHDYLSQAGPFIIGNRRRPRALVIPLKRFNFLRHAELGHTNAHIKRVARAALTAFEGST